MLNNHKKKYLVVLISAIIASPVFALEIKEHAAAVKSSQQADMAAAVEIFKAKHTLLLQAKINHKLRTTASRAIYEQRLSDIINDVKNNPPVTDEVIEELNLTLNGEEINAETTLTLSDLQDLVDSGQLDGASPDDPFFENPIFDDPDAQDLISQVVVAEDNGATQTPGGSIVVPELPTPIIGNHYYLDVFGNMTVNSVYVLIGEKFFEETTESNPLLFNPIFESSELSEIIPKLSVGSNIPVTPINDQIFNEMIANQAFHNINADHTLLNDPYFTSISVLRTLFDAEVGRNFGSVLRDPSVEINQSIYTFDDLHSGLEDGSIQLIPLPHPFFDDPIFNNHSSRALLRMYGIGTEE